MKFFAWVLSGVLALACAASSQTLSQVAIATSNASGAQLTGGVDQCLVSNDGTKVVFRSNASNLGFPVFSNGFTGLYLRDLVTGQFELLVADSAGMPAPVFSCRISGDARYVAFTSTVANPAGAQQCFVLDRQTGTRELISKTAAGLPANGTFTSLEDISADGRYILLATDATNLAGAPTGGTGFILWRFDRTTGVYAPVTINAAGQPVGSSFPFGDMSSDGRFVAFTSSNPNLVANDTNGVADTFVRDMNGTMIERVSVNTAGLQDNGFSQVRPSLSDDARFVVFRISSLTIATNGQAVGTSLVLRDRVAHTTEFLALTPAGQTAIVDFSTAQPAVIAPQGNIVYFVSFSNLSGSQTPTGTLWTKNLLTGLIAQAIVPVGTFASSIAPDATVPNLSQDGNRAAFTALAPSLVLSDSNGDVDGFVGVVACEFSSTSYGTGHAGSGGITPFLFANAGSCTDTAAVGFVGALGGAQMFLLVGGRDFTPTVVGQAEILVEIAPSLIVLALPNNGLPGIPGAGAWLGTGNVSAFRGLTVAIQGAVIDPGAAGGIATTAGVLFSIL